MVVFPNAKINIGLRVLRRRPDGYHDIESLMIPVAWCDILEIVPASGPEGTFTLTGSDLGGCPPEKNLVLKALRALEQHIGNALPPLDIYLHKVIPDGAGLGGGSADASFALRCANELLSLGLNNEELAAVAAKVGADCPFFIYNRPMLVQGIGDKLSPAELPAINELAVAIVKPAAEAVSTKEAYQGITPRELDKGVSLLSALGEPISEWKRGGVVVNDFERHIFSLRPQIARTLDSLSHCDGALYCAMSGSGAAVFGLFESVNLAEKAVEQFGSYQCFVGKVAM